MDWAYPAEETRVNCKNCSSMDLREEKKEKDNDNMKKNKEKTKIQSMKLRWGPVTRLVHYIA